MVDLGNDVVLENTGTSWDNNAANGNFEEGSRFLQVFRIRNKTTQTLQKTERNVKILYNWFSEVCKESRKCTKFRHLNWICTMQGFSFQEEDVTVPNTNQRLWENISGASLVTFVNMAIGTTLLNQWFSHRREVLMSKRKQLKSEGKGNRKRKTLAQDNFIKLRESAS